MGQESASEGASEIGFIDNLDVFKLFCDEAHVAGTRSPVILPFEASTPFQRRQRLHPNCTLSSAMSSINCLFFNDYAEFPILGRALNKQRMLQERKTINESISVPY